MRSSCIALLTGFLAFTAHIAMSKPILFPAPATTAAGADAAFGSRASAIIEANACGREIEYERTRTKMADGDFSDQGENLTSILVGKIAWIRAHGAGDDCTASVLSPRVRKDERTWRDPDLTSFAVADQAARAAAPTSCARETKVAPIHDADHEERDAVLVDVAVAPDCMRKQVNEAIRAMRKRSQMGTDHLRCAETAELIVGRPGDYDVNVRELVRLLYLGSPPGGRFPVLEQSTIEHMYQHLLAARGGPSKESYSVLADCEEPAGEELGSPEDSADRHAWYQEFADAVGDFFKWLIAFHIKVAASALSSATALGAAPFLLVAGVDPSQAILPHFDIRVEETENHRLMIETSRFLTNAAIITHLAEEQYDHVDDIRSDQAQVREWLLRRLQDIAAHDFREYNARPYTRYSLEAILNLHDFAGLTDPALQTASRIVLDLSAAKFAAVSNRGRRVVPFRRLSDNDGDDPFEDPAHPGPHPDLYNISNGADHEVARAIVLAGQTQLIPGEIPRDGVSVLVNTAVSPYRLPPPVLANAVERRAFVQTIRHASVEVVVQSPAFTVSAGGVRTGPTSSILGQTRDVDRGVAMPTVVIPTVVGNRMGDLFGFGGVGRQHDRANNTCVAGADGGGFACGIQPRLSAALLAPGCQRGSSTSGESFSFVSSAACFPALRPAFYIALRSVDCPDTFCAHGRQWGVLNIVEANPPPPVGGTAAPDPEFARFEAERRAALAAVVPDEGGNATYVTSGGRRIDFNLAETGPVIRAVDGVPSPPWATAGGAIEADGQGKATLKGPGGTVTIDFSDWANPRRSP